MPLHSCLFLNGCTIGIYRFVAIKNNESKQSAEDGSCKYAYFCLVKMQGIVKS